MMKRLFVFLLPGICCLFPALLCGQISIYVAAGGNDAGPGSSQSPKATLHAALRQVRELRRLNDPSIGKGAVISIKSGTYYLQEPIVLRPEDAGTPASPTRIEGAPDNTTVLSGGKSISGWKKATGNIPGLPTIAKGHIWEVDIPLSGGRLWEFRQLWVNDVKAIRARDRNADSMNRIISWNKSTGECWIPTAKSGTIANAAALEMVIHQWWAIAILRVKKAAIHGDSTRLTFHEPESRIQNEHPWPAPWLSKETGNSAFYLTNAIQFLDQPGEWFADMQHNKLYYWPRDNENMQTAKVIAPVLETLVKVEGTIDHPVKNISFNHISFAHTGWLRPSQQGHVPHQIGMYMLDAYKLKEPGTPDKKTLENQAWVGRPAAAMTVSFADSIYVGACRFEHMASTALDYGKAVHNSTVNGNLFKDIGGTAIMAGIFSDEAIEVHLPYNPSDEREITDGIRISNNLVTNATNEDWGCAGIAAGYVRNTNIEHNEISDVCYTGISLGWGWTRTKNAMKNNRITANKIHHYGKQMYDVAAIYTLSAQPGTVISENYIDSIYSAPYAHIPSHWFYLYTDEGSSYMTVKNNWTPSAKFLQNANGPGNVWENNGPQEASSIKQQAGLLPEYNSLAKEKSAIPKGWPINREQPAVIEIVANGQAIDAAQLDKILVSNGVHPGSLYQWKNHYVIFDKVKDVYLLRERLAAAFRGATVKVYFDMFYEFNRERCGGNGMAKEWDHVLLTANLVADTKLQKEYLDYHATQFEKWPEIAKGFCNASFQQLLLYRNGRQLMLIISIPKGESLDKLNPKTTENNPRVDEWNALMKKYQEGIPGTVRGETWVFLKKVEY
jgi:hypothetical protein